MEKKKHHLLLVQVDDISGEIVGEAINALMGMGAANVQVISTITKKNRAGYIFLIDCPQANMDRVSHYLQSELSVGGYHILASSHIAQQSRLIKKKIEIRVGGQTLEGECVAKVLSSTGPSYTVKVEHSWIVELKGRIKSELGIDISTNRLQSILRNLWQEELGNKITVKLY